MSQQQAEALLVKYKNGQCTAAEKAIVEKWLFQFKGEGDVLSDQRIAEIGQEIWSNLPQLAPKLSKLSLWPRLLVAAVVLIVAGGGLLYYSLQHNQVSEVAKQISHDVLPGSNKAYLTLANGSKISLTEAANGNIAKEAGVSITKTADGQLVYTITSDDNADINKSNTISTPKGGQWQLRLPDGSIVWLNAASSLTYPASFASLKERRVRLSGEAYFEIAKVFKPSTPGSKPSNRERVPFVVVTDKQEVEVLGTHFNISSYADEEAAKTTLLEGLVKINNFMLKPGEQAILSANKIKIAQVDTSLAVAWKNGIFKLDGTPLKELMRQISRWYDIDVVYEGDFSNRKFYGEIERSYSLSEVLKVFELGKIHFRIEREDIGGGKKLIVTP